MKAEFQKLRQPVLLRSANGESRPIMEIFPSESKTSKYVSIVYDEDFDRASGKINKIVDLKALEDLRQMAARRERKKILKVIVARIEALAA